MECIGVVGGYSGDSIVDKLHDRGLKAALVGGKQNEPGMAAADFVLVEDLSNTDKIVEFFLDNRVSYIIIGTGHIKAIQLAKILEERGFILSIDYRKSIFAKDKVLFKKQIEKMGLATPSYVSFRSDYDSEYIIKMIDLPCVVKSATDAIQPQKANTKDELLIALDEVFRTNTEILVEKYIKGNDCTVGILSDGVITKSLGVLYYSKAKEYGLKGFDEAFSAKLPQETEQELINISERIVKELNFIGLMRMDFIIDSQIYVLELNSIIVTGYKGSAYPFFRAQGIDIADEMVQNALRIYENKVASR